MGKSRVGRGTSASSYVRGGRGEGGGRTCCRLEAKIKGARRVAEGGSRGVVSLEVVSRGVVSWEEVWRGVSFSHGVFSREGELMGREGVGMGVRATGKASARVGVSRGTGTVGDWVGTRGRVGEWVGAGGGIGIENWVVVGHVGFWWESD